MKQTQIMPVEKIIKDAPLREYEYYGQYFSCERSEGGTQPITNMRTNVTMENGFGAVLLYRYNGIYLRPRPNGESSFIDDGLFDILGKELNSRGYKFIKVDESDWAPIFF